MDKNLISTRKEQLVKHQIAANPKFLFESQDTGNPNYVKDRCIYRNSFNHAKPMVF